MTQTQALIGTSWQMAKAAVKRFYKDVTVASDGESFVVQLDGRILKTPGKLKLTIPTKKAANLVAGEWDAQDTNIIPSTMPVTRLLNVAIERTPENRSDLIAEARKYAGTDLLCYREGKMRLHKEHQAERWDPVLAWAAGQGMSLKTTDSFIAISQDEKVLDKVVDYAQQLDNLALTLFVHLLAVYGSMVLAMAVMEKKFSGEEAFELSRLDELWQIRYWGEDEEAKKRTNNIRNEINALCALIE